MNQTPTKTMNQPPAGIIPKYLHQEQRRDDLLEAINRYIADNRHVPEKWLQELAGLNREINQQHREKNNEIPDGWELLDSPTLAEPGDKYKNPHTMKSWGTIKPLDLKRYKNGTYSHHLVIRRQIPDTETEVCKDIKNRQQLGINKYGSTVANNPLSQRQWIEHAYQECLDQAVYLKRLMQQIDNES